MLGGPAVVSCEPSRTEPCEGSEYKDKASGVCLKGIRRKDKQRQEGTVDKGVVFVAGEEERSVRDQRSL